MSTAYISVSKEGISELDLSNALPGSLIHRVTSSDAFTHIIQVHVGDPDVELPGIRRKIRKILQVSRTMVFLVEEDHIWIGNFQKNRHAFVYIGSGTEEVFEKLVELRKDAEHYCLNVGKVIGRSGYFVVVRAAHAKHMPGAIHALRQLYRYVDVYEVST